MPPTATSFSPTAKPVPIWSPGGPTSTACRSPFAPLRVPARILWEQAALPLAAVRHSLDVMLNPGFTAPLFAPAPRSRCFTTCSTSATPSISAGSTCRSGGSSCSGRRTFRACCWPFPPPPRPTCCSYYRLPESKVRVAPQGVDPVFFEIARRRHPEPFLLAVSTLHPHKNLDGLLRAFAGFRRTHPEFRLVVCGLHGFSTGPLHDLRDSLGLRDAVDFPGWIPREDLHDLYARAWAFVYPSLFEGFGLPLLEALAAGIPTACSGIEPLPSIAGGAALEFDPLDATAMRRSHGAHRDRRGFAGAPGRSRAAARRAVLVAGDGGRDAGGAAGRGASLRGGRGGGNGFVSQFAQVVAFCSGSAEIGFVSQFFAQGFERCPPGRGACGFGRAGAIGSELFWGNGVRHGITPPL